jgi:hypothetical protein
VAATFSPTDACVEGFRVVRRHPWAMLAWGVFLLIGYAIAFALLAALGLTAAFAPGAMTNPANPTAAVTNGLVIDAVILPFSLILNSIFLCAVYRSVLRPEDKGFAYLKIGGDEVRVFVVSLVFMVLALVAELGLAMVVGVAVAAVYKANQGAGFLVGLIAGIAFFCVVVWLVVRLSLAYVQTFAEKRIRIFDSWRLTKGRFWPMFGMYVLTALICLGVLIALYIAMIVVMLLGMGPMFAAAAGGHTPDFTTAGPMFFVAMIVALVVGIAGFSLIYTILYAPQASAYRQLAGDSKAAEVF